MGEFMSGSSKTYGDDYYVDRRDSITAGLHRLPRSGSSSFSLGDQQQQQPQQQRQAKERVDTALIRAVRDIKLQAESSTTTATTTQEPQLFQLVESPPQTEVERQDEMFPLELEESRRTEGEEDDDDDDGGLQMRVAGPSKSRWQDKHDEGSRGPVGRLAAYLLSSGLAQNWFFRREDSTEQEKQEEEGEEEAKVKQTRKESRRMLRDLNLWSPQTL